MELTSSQKSALKSLSSAILSLSKECEDDAFNEFIAYKYWFAKDLCEMVNEIDSLDESDSLVVDQNDDVLASCAICGKDRPETEVNLVDYELDVCISCEPEYRKLMHYRAAVNPTGSKVV